MRYKTDKLRARIIEKFGSQKAFAEAMGMTEACLSRTLSRGSDWKHTKFMKAINLLEIPQTQISEYFFEPEIAFSQKAKGEKK